MSNIRSSGYNNNTISQLQSEGYSISIDHPNEYRKGGRHLREVELEYIRDRGPSEAFGKDTRLAIDLKSTLSLILLENGNFSRGEMVLNDLVKELETIVGAEHPS